MPFFPQFSNLFVPPYAIYLPEVSLLLHMNGYNESTVFTDSSLNNFSVTANGNAQISTAEYKYGGASGYFDGDNDYLVIPNDNKLNFETSDFTVEAWIYLLDNTLPNGIFGQEEGGIAFAVNADGYLFADQANVGGSPLFSETTVTTEVWHHVAVARQNGYARLFLDGIIVAEGSWSASLSSSNDCVVGDLEVGLNNWPFYGYIDDLRIIKNQAVYTENFTPPTSELPNS